MKSEIYRRDLRHQDMMQGRLFLLALGLAAVLLAVVWTILDKNVPEVQVTYDTEEIGLDEAPEWIQEQVKEALDEYGADFLTWSNGEGESYVLISSEPLVGLEMDVEPENRNGILYFAIILNKTNNQEEKTFYTLYKTTSPTSNIETDILRLRNPYLEEGSEGFEEGYIKKMDDKYYVLPISNPDSPIRVLFTGAEIEDGLYSYIYRLENDRANLLTVSRRETVEHIANIYGVSGGCVTIDLGGETVQIQVSEKAEESLESVDFTNYSVSCLTEIGVEEGILTLISAEIIRYAPQK